jgi:hypothetical protein
VRVRPSLFANGLVVQALFGPCDFLPDLRARLLDTSMAAFGSLTAKTEMVRFDDGLLTLNRFSGPML